MNPSRQPLPPPSANPPHPMLPVIDRAWRAEDVTAFGKSRGSAFYEACHCYAQSLWQAGFPAKCILLLNRALSAPLAAGELVLERWPLPYRALAWLLLNRPDDQYLGNPRRHWQHLATRMVEPDKPLRTARAWACWYLAKEILPEADFPADLKQIREEGVVEPTFDTIVQQLKQESPADDLIRWQEALDWSREQLQAPIRTALPCRIRRIALDELPVIQQLAHRIWPACYGKILSEAQIRYMLAIWYPPDAMQREMSSRGTWFALIEAEAWGAVGYLSFEPMPGTDILFLNKLYILPELHGRGLGSAALTWVQERARNMGCGRVQLRVNKANAPAIRAYQRAGFRFVEDVCTDIGSGFVMDDFLMEKLLDDRSEAVA